MIPFGKTLLIPLALATPLALQGAEITWQAPFNITSVDSINTNGTLVDAVNATSGGDSPTVSVGGENITFTAGSIAPSNTSSGTFFTGGGGNTGNTNLNTVLNSHSYNGGGWTLQLTGLSSGADYQIQLIGAGDTRGCCSARNQRGGDDESPENVSGDFSRSGVGSVIGTFTASGTTQTINVLPGLNNGTDPGLSAYILRSVAPPTPQPPTDIALSNTDLAPNSASGTLVGILTTSDPNGDNAHAYSLVPGAGSTDNNLFTIANGDELRAASLLGGFGSTYSVRIRTTDGDGLTLDEPFTLTVESAMAPTAITFPANTILLGTPPGTNIANFITEDPNNADSHTYQMVAGAGDTNNSLFSVTGDTLSTATDLPGLGSNLSFRVRSTDLSGLSIEATFSLTIVSSSVRINEFLANSSSDSLADEDGDTPDWIELHNPDGGSIGLGGMYLTDDPTNLTKWLIPNVSIGGNEYLVIFASSKDRRPNNGENLHTNFNLSASGEYVALVAVDGITVLSEFGSADEDYPPQDTGISFGFFGDPLQIGYLLNPTPDEENDSSSGVSG
ncbi:MAG: lamin tail domain-containing protein, partial [Akkermansiaceae bacterium]